MIQNLTADKSNKIIFAIYVIIIRTILIDFIILVTDPVTTLS